MSVLGGRKDGPNGNRQPRVRRDATEGTVLRAILAAACAVGAVACAQVLGVDGDGYRAREGSGGTAGIDASADTAGKSDGASAGGNAAADASAENGGAGGSGAFDASAGGAGTGTGGRGGNGGVSGSDGKGGSTGLDASDGSAGTAGISASDSAVDGDSAASSDAGDSDSTTSSDVSDSTVDADGAASSDASDERDTADAGCTTGAIGLPGPSCSGLAATCGPNANGDCCASSVVCGGTYNRSNDATYPATVSDFRLDTYEITVGRFRKFAAVYTQNMIAAGAGKNPNNPSDLGWETAWNTSLPPDAALLAGGVQCNANYQTWTAGNDSRPINCLTWFVAQAFCIWDGGRLPTEAEWNYAAAGGSEQRVYPWGSKAPAADTNLAIYGCRNGNDAGTCTDVSNIAPVGSAVAGNSKWGQADLAGNLWEWAQDWYASPYLAGPCVDCADLTPVPHRVVRGGSFNNGAQYLPSAYRDSGATTNRGYDVGARCARIP